ncbi:hypothetical protein [Comamonas testosteroni]|uniref:hypothetical protein n=1 Tax=Comamonas testosteroni TaxID=285 RepID=UPI0028E34DDC|nr:hypothetical protein [Comamonas testosteroni]
METIETLSIEDEAGLAKSIEEGRSVKLTGGLEVHSQWSNYEMNLELLLITPDKKRRGHLCRRTGEGGEVILTKASAALQMARICLAAARNEI